MEFEESKENIQPLASGRNASILVGSLTSHNDLQKQREILEGEITNYEGDDPLEPWYNYILWIEQSYPSGGNESGLRNVLLKCLMTFEDDKRYYQDRRMIKIFIKYIDTEDNPIELYQELFNFGIGTMIADLYICWAYYYDLAGNFQKADSIFRKGLELRAQPYDELEQAYTHFGFTMSQRILHQDDNSREEFMISMKEKRHALTSLRPHKKKVGSIRTGSVIKNLNPGKIKVDQERPSSIPYSRNTKVQVFEDENKDPNFVPLDPEEHHIPVVRNIIDSARKQENIREPGPWNKGMKKKGHLFDKSHSHAMSFTILEDEVEPEKKNPDENLPKLPQHPNNYSKGIIIPQNFARKNYPQGIWKVETVADNDVKPQAFPQYNKMFHYPKPGLEFSSEEIIAYMWFKYNKKENNFMEEYKNYFENELNVGPRLYKNFSKKNLPSKNDLKLTEFKHSIPNNAKLIFDINELYPGINEGEIREEKQFEELLFEKLKSGKRKLKFSGDETIRIEEEMDETQCFTDIVGRKSIYPSRKSMAPFNAERKTIFKPTFTTLDEQQNDEKCVKKTSPKTNKILNIQEKSRKSVIIENNSSINSTINTDKIQEVKRIDSTEESAILNFPKIFKKLAISSNKSEILNKTDSISAAAAVVTHDLPPLISDQTNQNVVKECDPYQTENKLDSSIIKESKKFEIFAGNESKLNSSALKENKKFSIFVDENDTENLKEEKEKQFEVFVDENVEKPQVKTIETKKDHKLSNNFEIYEDTEKSFKFKQPLPKKNVLQPKTPVIAEDDFEVQPQQQGFAADETCSTQAFNLFISANLISTPIGKQSIITHSRISTDSNSLVKKPLSFNPDELHDTEPKAVIQNIKCVVGNSSISPICPEQPYKQLSTIMETSETNSLATGSTKSSGEPQFTFSNDIDNSLKHFETKNKSSVNSSKIINKSAITSKSFHENNEEIPVAKPNLNENEKLDEMNKFTKKQNNDVSHQLNMKSIQIFEEKTETVPKILLKRQACFEEPPADDLYNFFVKTPEKKGPALALPIITNPVSKANFEINDTITFSKLNEITLPKLSDQSKGLIKDSPVINMEKISFINDQDNDQNNFEFNSFKEQKSFVKKQTSTLNFEEQFPTLPKFEDLTLPKAVKNDKDTVSVSSIRKSKKLYFLQNSHEKINDATITDECKFDLSKENFKLKGESSKIATPFKGLEISTKNFNFSKGTIMFEDNIENNAFALNLSSKINSTFLPQANLMEKSLHIKEEPIDPKEVEGASNFSSNHMNNYLSIKENNLKRQTYNKLEKINYDYEFPSIQSNERHSKVFTEKKQNFESPENENDREDSEFLGRSIYVNYSFKTPVVGKHFWNDIEDDECTEDFVHHRHSNLDQTNMFIHEKILETNLNPFSTELTTAFLENIEFTNYISSLDSCELKGKLCMLSKNDEISVQGNVFIISKIIGEGGFGTVYSAKKQSNGTLYALKQEKPANLWEYYICLELRSRLQNVDILPGFMDVEYALVGNNASILISQYSPYGSFITVCNAYKRKTNKNLDEYVVMLLTSQILLIIDHLHASQIIHADIKPDNFLLMTNLSYPSKQLAIQLIDFGISIDMKLFPKNQTFNYQHTKEDNKCIEMRENRSWTYQIDLFGVAGIIHILLYGKYMDVHKNLSGFWAPKQRIPRYLNKSIWEPIFQNLLNVRDCNMMPNLQNLRTIVEEALSEKQKYVYEKVHEFNLILKQ